jgi:hypothetical protein
MDVILDVENYLLRGDYPPCYSKEQKNNLRRKCRNNFRLEDGILKYKTSSRKHDAEKDCWRICVRTVEEKYRVLESCHAGMEGELTFLEG